MMKTKEGNDYSLKKVLATLNQKKRFLFDEFGVIDLAIFGSYAKAQRELGWQPEIELRQSLKDVYEYWLERARSAS